MDKKPLPVEYEETLSSLKDLKEGDLLRGTIVQVDRDEILVDIGHKSEGIIPINEYSGKKINFAQIKIGEEIDALLLHKEDAMGRIILSHKKAQELLAWQEIVRAYEEKRPVQAKILSERKGGFSVQACGIKGFLPYSAAGEGKNALQKDIGKILDLRIKELDQRTHDIIFSRRLFLEEEKNRRKEEIFAILKIGEEREGEVKTLTPFGAFVDLGGIDGLARLEDLSWGRKSAEEILKVGQRIKVKVLNFDREKEKISLGVKQLTPDPWQNIEEKYALGKRVNGKIVKITSFGAFIEIEEGVEGLLRLEDISYKRTIKHPVDVLKEGQTIETVIIALDKENRRLRLSLKEALPDPWVIASEKYPPGTRVKGKIVKLSSFGAFLRLEEGIDGLIRLEDMSWTEKIKHPSEVVSRGRTCEAVVLKVDVQDKKIALGLKELTSSPWERFKKGAHVQGKVIRMDDFGAYVDLGEGIEGLVHVSQLSKDYVQKPEQAVQLGQVLNLKVLKAHPRQKKIELSVRQYDEDKESEEVNDYLNKQEKDELKLGDLLNKKW